MNTDLGIEIGKRYHIRRRFRKNTVKVEVVRISDWTDSGVGLVAWIYRIAPSGNTYGIKIPYTFREIESAKEIA